MTSRRDWQLQQLGITQWSLRRLARCRGDCHCDPGTRPSGDGGKRSSRPDRSFSERCSARINRQPRSSAATDARKIAMLPQGSRCNSWRLGTDEPLSLEGAQVASPALTELRATQRHAPRYGNKFAHMNTISSLETTDLPAAYHIEQRAHAFPWSEKTFASNQGERYLNFQLTQNGKMAAFAITQVVLDEATLFNIAVDPDYQRQGLGRVLLEHLIDELEKRGVATLWLEVRASNAAAIALYESLGFNEATIRRNYYPTTDGREDAIIMALPISM